MSTPPAVAPAVDEDSATVNTENPAEPPVSQSSVLPAGNSDSPVAESNRGVTPQPTQSTTASSLPISIPSYSRWFSWDKIHETERRLLPEFFDTKSPSRNPRTYRYYRDAIIKKYRENPSRKITFTEVRRRIVGDVGSIRRVFDFLENWGLINYTISRQNMKWEERESKSLSVSSSPNVFGSQFNLPASKKESAKKICDGCRSAISIACFSCDKIDLVLCARCFVRGNYQVGFSSTDFKRVDISEEPVRKDWSDKETLHLLEGIWHYKDNWKKVAEHVGTRSDRECVARFIRLPFGEQFMEPAGACDAAEYSNAMEGQSDGVIGVSTNALSSLNNMKIFTPLADASNPIMAQAAFLSALVGSEVAEAVAQAAVGALSEGYDSAGRSCESCHSVAGKIDDQDTAPMSNAYTEATEQLRQEDIAVEESISNIIEVQMKEIQDDIMKFEELEELMERERAQLSHVENLLFADQLTFSRQQAVCKASCNGDRTLTKLNDIT